MTERKYAINRLQNGDYVCYSNDGKWLWRFTKYEDGRDYGLVDAKFDRRSFWRAYCIPSDSPALDQKNDWLDFLQLDVWLRYRSQELFKSRNEAITWALSQPGKEV